jgi:hypothetical protein
VAAAQAHHLGLPLLVVAALLQSHPYATARRYQVRCPRAGCTHTMNCVYMCCSSARHIVQRNSIEGAGLLLLLLFVRNWHTHSNCDQLAGVGKSGPFSVYKAARLTVLCHPLLTLFTA